MNQNYIRFSFKFMITSDIFCSDLLNPGLVCKLSINPLFCIFFIYFIALC